MRRTKSLRTRRSRLLQGKKKKGTLLPKREREPLTTALVQATAIMMLSKLARLLGRRNENDGPWHGRMGRKGFFGQEIVGWKQTQKSGQAKLINWDSCCTVARDAQPPPLCGARSRNMVFLPAFPMTSARTFACEQLWAPTSRDVTSKK